jgi:hypothetical protein
MKIEGVKARNNPWDISHSANFGELNGATRQVRSPCRK